MPLSGSASPGAEASSLNTVSAYKGVAWTKSVASAALLRSVRYRAIAKTPEFNGGAEPGLVDRTAGPKLLPVPRAAASVLLILSLPIRLCKRRSLRIRLRSVAVEGGGEKMSKHSASAGDIAALLARFSELMKKAFALTGRSFPTIVINEPLKLTRVGQIVEPIHNLVAELVHGARTGAAMTRRQSIS